MANDDGRGLGQPIVTGKEDIFQIPRTALIETPRTVDEKKTGPSKQPRQPKETRQRETTTFQKQTDLTKPDTTAKVKTSVALSKETARLLRQLKLEAGNRKDRFVSADELLAEALHELANKWQFKAK